MVTVDIGSTVVNPSSVVPHGENSMSKSSFKELKKKSDQIYQRYDAHFAGKPRATRDLDLLDELLGELSDLVNTAKNTLNGSRDPAMVSLLDMAKQNLDVYKNEREAIVAAKEKGPTSALASEIVREANLTFGRYHRHFAGKDRRTRDLGVLTEIIVELERIQQTMKGLIREQNEDLQQNLDVVEKNIEMYRKEYRAIESAQEAGTRQEQADALATLANNQFKLYREHFAGKARHTRRPGLLDRMINQLKRIHKAMAALKRGGLASQPNDRNMGIVSENLKVYKTELAEIEKARESVTTDQLAGSLGGSANEIMAQYRENFAGESRQTRDLELLSLLADSIAEIAFQMRSLQRTDPGEVNAKNLAIVMDAWTMYEAEYRRIEEAKGQ